MLLLETMVQVFTFDFSEFNFILTNIFVNEQYTIYT